MRTEQGKISRNLSQALFLALSADLLDDLVGGRLRERFAGSKDPDALLFS
jgi:hypothetical protein